MTYSYISGGGRERVGSDVVVDLVKREVRMTDKHSNETIRFGIDEIDRIEIEETPKVIDHTDPTENQTEKQ